MADKSLDKHSRPGALSDDQSVDRFLDTLGQLKPAAPGEGRGRLIFALDATASRQATWDEATTLQGDMFTRTRGIGSLDVQLVFYRGYRECRSSAWVNRSATLLALMRKVRCEAGRTQIGRVLSHALAEARLAPVQALVFVGDCVEEPIDTLGDLAGQLRLLGLPVFVFQEGHDANASRAFATIARLSGGAHGRFDHRSPQQLADLLNAVAAYAAGGRRALQALSRDSDASAALLRQLD